MRRVTARMTGRSRRVAAGLLAAAQVPTAASLAYLLTLLAAARRRTPPPPAPGTPRVTVLIPAHDEGAGVRATVASVRALDWPAERLDVVVIADNCTDDTAAQAAAAGARVLERDAPDARGKGRALAWAVERLAAAGPPPDAVVVVDADCTVEPGLLRAFAAALGGGRRGGAGRATSSRTRPPRPRPRPAPPRSPWPPTCARSARTGSASPAGCWAPAWASPGRTCSAIRGARSG